MNQIDNKKRKFKITLIGALLTGKSQFFSKINPRKESPLRANNNCDICSLFREIEKNCIQINIVNTSGSKSLQKERLEAMRGSDQILIFFDVNNPQTFNQIKERWLSYLSKNNIKAYITLIGNKIDKKTEVKLEEVEKLKSQYGFDLYYTSSFNKERCKYIINSIIKKLLLREIIFKKEEDFTKVLQIIVSISEENEENQGQKRQKKIQKDFIQGIIQRLENIVQQEEEMIEEKENLEYIENLIKKIKLKMREKDEEIIHLRKNLQISKQGANEKEDRQAHEISQLKQKVDELNKKIGIFKNQVKALERLNSQKDEKMNLNLEIEKQQRLSFEIKQQEFSDNYDLLFLFKESSFFRNTTCFIQKQIKNIIESDNKGKIKDITNLSFPLKLKEQDKKDIILILKIDSNFLLFYSSQKFDATMNSGIVISYQGDHQIPVKWTYFQKEKCFYMTAMVISYGDNQLSIKIFDKKKLTLKQNNLTFVHNKERLHDFFQQNYNEKEIQLEIAKISRQ